MDKNDKIYVAGHTGLIGSAIVRRLVEDGYANILTKSHAELDLTNQKSVRTFLEKEKPDYVFFAAAKVGGIFANNTYRAEFIYENMMMQNNVIHYAFFNEVKKMVFLACADVYPKNCPQPAKEEYLLTGPLEPTCEPFAIAKIAGIKMCESYNRQYGTDFIVVIPPNVYGPHQHYDIMNSQVLPSLTKRFHDAKVLNSERVVLWGSGTPVRDFLFVDDVAHACIFLVKEFSGNGVFNIGTGSGHAIQELAETIKNEVGYKGKILFDKTKPDGVSKKLLDTTMISNLKWRHKIELSEGIKITYKSFLTEIEKEEIRTSRIFRITPAEKDTKIIDEIKSSRCISNNVQPDNYKNKVVLKPWGYEFLVFENDCIAVWLLYIKKDFSTSIHSHPTKKTSLILLSGSAMITTFSNRKYLKGGDALIIEKGVFHSTKAISDEGVFLLETETPPNKIDLMRLEDRYGRAMSGYEGILEMQSERLQDYNYFYFEESDGYEKHTYTTDKFVVSFEAYSNNNEFQRYFKTDERALYTSCRGKLTDGNNNVLLDIGDTQTTDVLSNAKGTNIAGKTVLLKTKGR